MKIKTSAGINKYHWDFNEFGYLVHVLGQSKKFGDILNLFIDLHTPQEIAEIVRRVIIASMLEQGMTYIEIKDATGASSTTIAKIQQKFYRQKSKIQESLKKAGSFDKFIKRSAKDRDELTRYIDGALSKRSLGLFGRK